MARVPALLALAELCRLAGYSAKAARIYAKVLAMHIEIFWSLSTWTEVRA